MIPSRYIRRFLDRVCRDYRRLNKMTEPQLEIACRWLPRLPLKWPHLARDQKISVLVAISRPRFAIWSDPSCGKTLIAMVAADYHRQAGKLRRVLVLVPRRANKEEWSLQAQEHCPHLGCVVLRGSSEEKWRQLRDSSSLFVVETYAGFARMVCYEQDGRLQPDCDLLEELAARFSGVICDESSELGGGAAVTRQSLIFRLVRRLSRRAFMFLALSGTPFGRDPSLLWAQMYLVDHGETLGRSLGLFKAAFFGAADYWGKQKFLADRRRDLHRLLANGSIRFTVAESEVPRRRPLRRYVGIPVEQQDWLRRFYDTLWHDPDRRRKESAFLRIRQLSSGFVGFVDDESGERAQVVFAENPKLEALCDLALSIPADYQFLVFHEWIVSGEWIAREFSRLGISHSVLRGNTADPKGMLQSFRRGDSRAMIINHKSGDFGLNLQMARYSIHYESPLSAITRKQTEMRTIRRHSRHDWVAIIDLLMKGTMDERVLEFHAEGRDLFAAILDGRIGDR